MLNKIPTTRIPNINFLFVRGLALSYSYLIHWRVHLVRRFGHSHYFSFFPSPIQQNPVRPSSLRYQILRVRWESKTHKFHRLHFRRTQHFLLTQCMKIINCDRGLFPFLRYGHISSVRTNSHGGHPRTLIRSRNKPLRFLIDVVENTVRSRRIYNSLLVQVADIVSDISLEAERVSRCCHSYRHLRRHTNKSRPFFLCISTWFRQTLQGFRVNYPFLQALVSVLSWKST